MTLVERLGLEHPVVQAGMGGGIASAELAGAVSAAGALGTVGILPPERMERELFRAREIAPGRAVAANLLTPFTTRAHVRACQRTRVEVVVLHGGFDRALVERLRGAGTFVLQTIGTVPEAKRALAEDADGLIVQGIEAGGHLLGVEPALAALARVLPIAGDRPVLLAGGMAEAADVGRALDAGAAAAVAGTRFLLTHECAAHPAYKAKVLAATETLETRLFGLAWPMRHRVVPNAATERWCRRDGLGPRPVRMLQSLSVPLSRLPMSLMSSTILTQRAGLPVFGPAAPLADMPERVVEASALYAGETALRIGSVLSAGEAVSLLSGAGSA